MKYSKDGLVLFHPQTHTYFKKGKQLQSVTSYIDTLKEKFDTELIGERYAKKHSLNKEVLLKEWSNNGEKTRTEGTALHLIFETYFKRFELLKPVNEKQYQAVKFINDYFINGKLIFSSCEDIIYNDNLAGTRDAVVKNDKGEYFIFDWKTSKEISKENYGRFMLDPFQQLPDANFFHYSLQLRLYQNMTLDYKIKDCYIVQFTEKKYNFIKAHDIKI